MIRNTNPTEDAQTASSLRTTSPLRLRFHGSQRHGQVVRINSNKCTIGSAPEATFRLIGNGIQPIHCLVLRGPNGMVVRRMSMDTMLNGKTFDDAALTVGDRLSIGPIEFEVLPPQVSEPAADAGSHENFQQQQEALSAAQTQLEAEKTAWQERCEAEHERIEKLRRELSEQSISASEELQHKITQLQQQLEQNTCNHQQELAAWQQQSQRTATELAAVQSALSERDASVAQHQAHVDAMRADFQSLQEQLQSANQEVEAHRNTIQQLEAKTSESWEERATLLEQQLQSVESARVAAEQQQQQLAERIQTMEASALAELESQQQAWKAERADMESQLEQLNHELSEAGTAKQQENERDQELRQQLASLQAHVVELEAGREADRQARDVVEREFEQARAKWQSELDTYRQVGEAREQLQIELEARIQQLENERVQAPADVPEPAPADEAPITQLEIEEIDTDEPVANVDATHHELPTPATTGDPSRDILAQLREEVANNSTHEEATEEVITEEPSASASEDTLLNEMESVSTEPPAEDFQTPVTEEDLTFSEPDESAPVDTAAILAKFGHQLEEEDDTPVPPPQPEPIPRSQETVSLDSSDEDESIEQYMAQLMQRVGGTPSSPPTATEEVQETKPSVTKTPTRPQEIEVEQDLAERAPLDPSEFVPRAVAPEAASNLQALRAVANTSARDAIDKHLRNSMDKRAILFWFISIVSGIVCLSMGFFATSILSLPTLVSGLTFVVSLASALRAVTFSAKAKVGLQGKQRQLTIGVSKKSETPSA